MMYTLEQIQTALADIKAELQEKYYINEIGVFGSFATGKANSNSRIRVLVEFNIRPGAAKFIGLSHQIQTLFGVKVELVDKDKMKSKQLESIANEIIYI